MGSRTFIRAALAAAFAITGLLIGAAPAASQIDLSTFPEKIESYDVDLVVQPDGDLHVTEEIVYDFGTTQRRGIFREIPVRYDWDDRYERIYRVHGINVETSGGAPDDVEVTDEGRLKIIRIGDPDTYITGKHTYTISYRVEGTINGFPDHEELFWNAVGAYWAVPIERSTVDIVVPAAIGQTACFAGSQNSQLPCASTSVDGRTAHFRHGLLLPYQGFTAVAGFPPGTVADTTPILDEKWHPSRAFAMTPATVAGTGGLAILAIGGVSALAWQQGRDRRYIGSSVDATFGTEEGHHEAVPLFAGDETPVEFAPPDNLRPGQIGTLIDEVAHPLDVTATIVDLAVRGYMRIEEIEKKGWFGKGDWRLVKLKEADAELVEYERMLFGDLFDGKEQVELSDLKNTFATEMRKVQSALYDDAVSRGWFLTRPDKIRGQWIGIGVLVLIVGIGLTVAAAAFTSFGLLPIPIAVAGFLLLVLSGKMPHRTAAGTGVLRRTLGFRRFIEESEKERARFAERAHLFTEYLPYAVVFGATEKWAKAFAGLNGELPDTGTWYVGHHPGVFHVAAFSSAMNDFSTTSAGTLTSTPGSSGGSGFGGGGSVGGGGGGGGGGSW